GVAMCVACLAFFAGILVLLTLEADTRQALIATPAWFVLLGVAYRFLRKRQLAAAASATVTPLAANTQS
nr:D-serine/D-alanine/glycine transporter [Comamonas sp.]